MSWNLCRRRVVVSVATLTELRREDGRGWDEKRGWSVVIVACRRREAKRGIGGEGKVVKRYFGIGGGLGGM